MCQGSLKDSQNKRKRESQEKRHGDDQQERERNRGGGVEKHRFFWFFGYFGGGQRSLDALKAFMGFNVLQDLGDEAFRLEVSDLERVHAGGTFSPFLRTCSREWL